MVHLLAAVAHGRSTLTALFAVLLSLPARAEPPRVLVARFSGVISPAASEYLQSAIRRAEERRASALVIELDTPGGLDASMREIVKAELAATVPVIVYVHPAGARAASAGVFITMAAHVAAMTPGTNIGAAHPVPLGGAEPLPAKGKETQGSVMEAKLTSDASAYLEAIAARRGRNARWAEPFVAKSTSIPSAVAARGGVVDLEADNLDRLLGAVDGRKLPDLPMPLRTKDARVERFEMTSRQRLLAAVSDPNIALILMSLGVSGLLIELYSPGLILPGVVGGVSLVLAFYSFSTLSANFAGVLLILIGALLYILELKITSYGLLGLSGTAAILFGMLMLFKETAGQGIGVSGIFVLSTLGTMVAILAGLLYLAKKILTQKAVIGLEAIRGELAVAATELAPRGNVTWRGELWRAESLEGEITAGSEVVVERAEGLTLKVRKK